MASDVFSIKSCVETSLIIPSVASQVWEVVVTWYRSKHVTFSLCRFNVGPRSTTLAQHKNYHGQRILFAAWNLFIIHIHLHTQHDANVGLMLCHRLQL